MDNRNVEEARRYHDLTKHSYHSVRSDTHILDWDNRPSLYKVYPDLPRLPLPRDFGRPEGDALEALGRAESHDEKEPGLKDLSRLLFFSVGETKKKSYPGGDYNFRAAACAGALYPVEIYLVSASLEGLEAGIYHFNPGEFALTRLRAGDYRSELAGAAGDNQAIAAAPVTLVLTGLFWRSAWKYRARCYRYCFWDSGTILANLLAVAAAEQINCSVEMGFGDAKVNHLLGVDGVKEASLCLVPLGRSLAWAEHAVGREVPDLTYRVAPLSPEQIDYPALERMHAASCLTDEEIRPWRGFCQRSADGERMGREAIPLSLSLQDSAPLGKVILKRGSTRRFARVAVRFDELSTLLYRSTRGIPTDFLEGNETSLLDIYLIVNAVEGLESGAYYFSPVERKLELLQRGAMRHEAGYLCLEQALAADASAVIFFLADLERVLGRFGNRGYRATQLEAGITGGRLYLAAYALGLGASGLTFYDDDVVKFFSPHAEGKDAIFVVALGRASKRGANG